MKKILSKTAVTLVELIVASLLVAIVILGVFSINMVLSTNNQDYGQRYLVKSETQTTLNHILNNVSLAYGSAALNDEGILIGGPCPGAGGTLGCGDPVNNPNSFCIHQAGTAIAGGANLVNSAGDIWLCYTLSANQIKWCAETYAGPGADPRGASSCSSSASLIANPATGATSTFLGRAFSITNTVGTNLASSPELISSPTQLLFSINILNCLNDSSCQASGTSSDPADNPEIQLSGSVIPLQVSS